MCASNKLTASASTAKNNDSVKKKKKNIDGVSINFSVNFTKIKQKKIVQKVVSV